MITTSNHREPRIGAPLSNPGAGPIARSCSLAAEQGNAAAQGNLGAMYSRGEGVPKDFVTAYMWRNLAAAQGNEIAKEARDALETLMTPAQIAQAQKLSREWKPKKP